MQLKLSTVLFFLSVLESVFFMGCSTVLPKTLIFFNGKITTLDPKKPEVSALAIANGRIVATGTNEEIFAQFKDYEIQINLEQKRVIPGLIDAHAHFLGIGYAKLNLNLTGTQSENEILDLVREQVNSNPPGEWLKGRGWDQNDWLEKQFPTHYHLSRISPENPVVLTRIDGHALWCNQKALKIAQITAKTPDPTGGKIIRDAQGNPTGVFIDNAMSMILKHVPKPSKEQNLKAAKLAAHEALSLGITSIHDAGSNENTIEIMKELHQQNIPMPRLYVMLDGEDEKLLGKYFISGPDINDFIAIRSIKLYADGALGSRGAALLEPYKDDKNNSGLLLLSEDQIVQITSKALQHGFQVSTHAIGDKANRLVLDAYEKAFLLNASVVSPRLRVEHAQIVHPDDIKRFRQLNIIASMQPTHCTSDMPWVPQRLGEKRTKTEAYMWRSFLNQNVIIAAGSDAPIEDLNPFFGLYSSITRQDHECNPKNGFYPEQKLMLQEALEAFTLGGAFAEFQEHQKGFLAPGTLADLVVLSKDIFAMEPLEILTAQADMTVIDGKIVYQRY